MLLDSLRDIIKHTYGLGFIDMVKLIGTDKDAKIEAMDADKTVVIFGELYQPIKGIETTVGFSRMAFLKGFIDLHEGSDLTIVNETRSGVDVPTEILFDDKAGLTSNYRFMSDAVVNEQIKVPPFKGATWNVTVEPTKKSIARLSNFTGVLGAFESTFIVSLDKGTLNFAIGAGPTDRANIPFATGVTGALKHQWIWPLSQVISILKLADAAECKMNFSDMGALKIDIDSGTGRYSYILPARSK
jgi:hypothetical protein